MGILNKHAWNNIQHTLDIFVYSPGDSPRFGYIGTEFATEHLVNCAFPADGGTAQRDHHGCGKSRWPHSGLDGGEWDWCSSPPSHILSSPNYGTNRKPGYGGGWFGCSLPNNGGEGIRKMIGAWRDAITQVHSLTNEVVVDGKHWNTNVADNIWAFVLPDQCVDDDQCYSNFYHSYQEYKAANGEKTVLRINPHDEYNPFSLVQQPLMQPRAMVSQPNAHIFV